MTIEKEVGVTPLYQRNRDSKKRTIVDVGGSGSSKSHTLAQLFIEKFFAEKNKQFIVTRKTMPSLRRSSYALIIDLMTEYDLYDKCEHSKSDNVLTYGRNMMWFFGLDEPSKAKSLAGGASYIWMEEADEFTYDDYMAFKLQLRKQTEDELNHIYLSFNPIDGSGWIPTKLIPQSDVEVIHSTIDDNPFAEPEYVKALKDMAEEDDNYYRVYVLGEWGRLENLIFPNYVLVDSLPKEFDSWCYGLDFGYVHPTALLKVLMFDKKLYWHEALCQSGLTNSDLIERLGHLDKADIYADSAEPQRIEEIHRAGFNIYPANKDVKMGIDACRRQTIHITKESVTLIKQIRGYQRKKDKDGNILEEPVKYADDTIDAGRYGTMGMTDRYGFATRRPVKSEPVRTLDFKGHGESMLDKILAKVTGV